MRKLGALDSAMENLGPLPFDDAMRKLETLVKQWGNCGELNDLMRKMGKWAPDDAMEHKF